ncbi:hypothetical protein Tco_0565349 [Tanacetum coccineum]
MRGTMQNKVDRETRFNNEFDQFVAESGEALVSVYNRFAQLMNDLERNDIKFPKVIVNTKFLNCLQLEWLKDAFQNNSEDPLTSAMMLLARAITQRFSNPTNNHLRTSSNTINQAIVQANRVNIQSRNSGNNGRNTRRSYVQEEVIDGPIYDSAFLSEVQQPSTGCVYPLFAKDNQEQKYLKQPKIINDTIGDGQIDSNIIFDEPNVDVNSGRVE